MLFLLLAIVVWYVSLSPEEEEHYMQWKDSVTMTTKRSQGKAEQGRKQTSEREEARPRVVSIALWLGS